MLFVRSLLDRLLVVCAVVAGGLVPGFIAQYRQRLGGRLDQARLDLEPWQRLADQFHHGDIRTLIQYHLDSGDAKFHAEGAVIRSLVDTVHQLQSAVEDRKSTRLNSSHGYISYAVFCLKKKNSMQPHTVRG